MVSGVDYSDHRSFWSQGYPAVMFTYTAFYRNPNYHKATDTPETLNYEYMAEFINSPEPAILQLAGETGAAKSPKNQQPTAFKKKENGVCPPFTIWYNLRHKGFYEENNL